METLLNFNFTPPACFLDGILCVFAVFLNFLIYIFLNKKIFAKQLSNFLTAFAFFVNAAILTVFYVKNAILNLDFNVIYFKNLFLMNNEALLLKILINAFAFCFILITYKITQKTRFKIPVANSILLFIVCVSSLLAQVQNFLVSYVFLDVAALLIYRFASDLRIKKQKIYSVDFISISGCATVLFAAFYLMAYSVQNPFRLSILKVCLTGALFLKIGFFPVYNYIINRNYKINIPYSILLYSYLPFLGVIVFNKMAQTLVFADETYQITMVSFVFITMLIFSLYCFKTKNLIKFLACFSNFITGVCFLGVLFLPCNFLSIKLSAAALFNLLAIYSILCVLKINLKPDKMNISVFQNLFVNNKIFVFAFCTLLLMLCGVIPGLLSKSAFDLFSQIYLFDKISIYFIFGTILCDVLILFNVFNYIEQCYRFDEKFPSNVLTKRTTLNYAVLLIVIICLILFTFL